MGTDRTVGVQPRPTAYRWGGVVAAERRAGRDGLRIVSATAVEIREDGGKARGIELTADNRTGPETGGPGDALGRLHLFEEVGAHKPGGAGGIAAVSARPSFDAADNEPEWYWEPVGGVRWV